MLLRVAQYVASKTVSLRPRARSPDHGSCPCQVPRPESALWSSSCWQKLGHGCGPQHASSVFGVTFRMFQAWVPAYPSGDSQPCRAGLHLAAFQSSRRQVRNWSQRSTFTKGRRRKRTLGEASVLDSSYLRWEVTSYRWRVRSRHADIVAYAQSFLDRRPASCLAFSLGMCPWLVDPGSKTNSSSHAYYLRLL